MEVVIASALPSASTMLMWLVPYSGCSGCGAKASGSGPGLPGLAVPMLVEPIRLARCFR